VTYWPEEGLGLGHLLPCQGWLLSSVHDLEKRKLCAGVWWTGQTLAWTGLEGVERGMESKGGLLPLVTTTAAMLREPWPGAWSSA
jgi:hypothetical protein